MFTKKLAGVAITAHRKLRLSAIGGSGGRQPGVISGLLHSVGDVANGPLKATLAKKTVPYMMFPNILAAPPSVFGFCRSYYAVCNTKGIHPPISHSNSTTAIKYQSALLESQTTATVGLPWGSTRTVTKCSYRKGRRKTVKAVIHRFYRLDWGAWISPIPGRSRHLWKKSAQRRQRLRRHIFRRPWEGKTLDRMVTKYWIKKKHFVDDPYESYHSRDNFRITKNVQGVDSTLLRHIKKYNVRK